jgi:GntP family gluconate:H+ symporter
MAGVAALIGLPLFFEIGVVLLIPVVLLVSRRSEVPLLKIAIPALAGLSVLHGLVPPHPGPLAAIAALNADLGLTLLFGLIIAVPTVIIAGPLFANLISRYVVAHAPEALVPTRVGGHGEALGDVTAEGRGADPIEDDGSAGHRGTARPGDVPDPAGSRRPQFWPAVLTILLPVVLMLARAIGELTLADGSQLRTWPPASTRPPSRCWCWRSAPARCSSAT